MYDYTEGVFWAEAALRSSSIVSLEYLYSYLVPFGSNLLMAPFVYLFGTTFLANELGMLIYYVIFMLMFYRLARSLFENLNDRLLFLGIANMFVFTYTADNMFHHLLCYGIGFACFAGQLSCLIDIENHRRLKRSWVLLMALCLWASLNGVASVGLSAVPVMLAFMLAAFKEGTLFKKTT